MTMSIFTSSSSAVIVVVKSSLLLALGWSATRLLHRAPASTRHGVWLTAIVGVLLMPGLDRLSSVPLRVLPAEPISAVARPFAVNTELARSTGTIQPTVFLRAAQSSTSGSATRLSLSEMIVTAYAIVAALMLVRLVLGVLTVARIARRGRLIDAPDWTGALSKAAQRLHVRALPRLVTSDEVDLAFAFDALSPVVVLPANAREWSHACRENVMLHELAHLRRRDVVGHIIAGVASALNWFNPLMWVAARQLRVESELACDEVVLRTGVHPSEYAQHLLDMVTIFSRPTPAVAMAMARASDLEGRIVAILDPARRPSMVARRHGVIAAGVLGLTTVSICAVAPMPGAGTDRVAGVAFQAATNHIALAVESAARRGRLDVLAIDSAAPVLRNGLNVAPLAVRGEYYLFDSTSFVLVRPASKTFAIFTIVDAAYNYDNGREGWPDMFDFPATIRTQPVSAVEAAARQLSRHGTFHVYWHIDSDWQTSGASVLSRGRLGVVDAPLGESTVVRWFGPALALAQLATIDSSRVSNGRIGLAAVAPLVGDDASTTNFISQQPLARLRIVAIDLARLTLPSDYKAVVIAGSLPESQAKERIAAWRTPPRFDQPGVRDSLPLPVADSVFRRIANAAYEKAAASQRGSGSTIWILAESTGRVIATAVDPPRSDGAANGSRDGRFGFEETAQRFPQAPVRRRGGLQFTLVNHRLVLDADTVTAVWVQLMPEGPT